MSQITLSPFANFNSAIPWGLWVSIYIWLIGISAGGFLLIAWGNLKGILPLKNITRLGIALSLSTLLAGLLSIWVDLGHIERFCKLFISPNIGSVMAWMVWLYGFYAVILAASLLWMKKGFSKSFLQFAVLFAFAIIIVESLLFAIPPGRHWHSPIFVLHFLSSSLASAMAALIFAASILAAKDKRDELLKGLARIAIPVILANFIIEGMEIILLGSATHIEGWFLPLGNIIAIALLLKHNALTITIAGCVELIDVLISKYNNLISGQMIKPFKGFSSSYIEPRLQFSYAPTAFEFTISVLLIGSAAIMCYFLYKIFPLTREE